MPSRPIRFFHHGAIVEIGAAAATRTVLDWLREDAHCTGTKEGCNEGDCGACTIVIGELASSDAGGAPDIVDGLRLRSANACLQFLPTLDGKALFTVEDLAATLPAAPHRGDDADADAAIVAVKAEASEAAEATTFRQTTAPLHPVQQAMVDCHASQCGFCTPGFVMSLWAMYQHHISRATRPSRQQIADELSGNLCRCTGYRPIVDAGERMFDATPAPLDARAVVAALESLRSAAAPAFVSPAGGIFLAPRSLDHFAAHRLARPDARILAGATDIGLWVNKMFRPLPELLYIGNVAELKRIEVRNDVLSIGAAASLEDAWRALVARWPSLAEVWLRFAGVPLRHTGTMGGNVANGSPIGDSAPVLMALGAGLLLRRGDRLRRLPLSDFYTGYMSNRLDAGEFLQAIEVPIDTKPIVRAWKISKRFDCDISAVCAGLAIELDDAGSVAMARFAFGGMAATAARATGAEQAVLGRAWDEAAVIAAQAALDVDFAPLSDMRGSAGYRRLVARNLLRRLWLETRSDAPLASAQTRVWQILPDVSSKARADTTEGATP